MYKYVTEPDYSIKFNGFNLGFDTETDGLNTRVNNLLLIQLSDGVCTYIFDCRILPTNYIKEIFARLDKHTFIAHNAKFDVGFLFAKYGIIPNKIHDTMLVEAIMNSGRDTLYPSLKKVVEERLGIEIDKSMQTSFLTPTRRFTEEQLKYAAVDSEVLLTIYYQQIKEIGEGKFKTVVDLEMALLPVVMKMEHYGIRFDVDRLLPVLEKNEQDADRYEQELFELAGKEFNPRSPKQVKEILHGLALTTGNKKLLVASTNADTLRRIKHPFTKKILMYRSSQKLVSTYGIKLVEKIETDGKIHCTFNQLGTVSGRLSSARPNLQNIPHQVEFRHLFRADEGMSFVTADYSQIELRLAGILSSEPKILNEYSKEDADLHRLTASHIFKVPPEKIVKEQRSSGKLGNFSSLYGVSARSMSIKQDISYNLAKEIIAGFWGGYPILRNYMYKESAKAARAGFVRTVTGRIRYLDIPSTTDPGFKYKLAAIKREGFNMKIQGFAADIMKYAMVMLDRDLGERGKILLTVHDEVGVEVNEEDGEEVTQIIKESMEKSAGTLVENILPMTVEAVLLDSWTK